MCTPMKLNQPNKYKLIYVSNVVPDYLIVVIKTKVRTNVLHKKTKICT